MVVYPDYITKKDVEEVIESLFSHRIDSLAYDAGVDIEIQVDDYLVPTIIIDTLDETISVDIATNKVVSESTGNPGYEFVPTINTAAFSQTMDLVNHDDIMYRYTKWGNIAKLADEIYCTEYYPLDWFEE